jgi:hypothetical protein
MTRKIVGRTPSLRLEATWANPRLPLVHIGTAGAAGKLKVALGNSFVPGADAAIRALIGQWGEETKTEVQVDSVSELGLTLPRCKPASRTGGFSPIGTTCLRSAGSQPSN